jgi:hypothetical protein
MQEYDQMESGIIVPFAMLSGPINYESKNIHTDEHGFRLTKFKDRYISINDIDKFDEINIVIGGSTVFGVGSTSDDTTIASVLSNKTNEPWFNLGVRGGISFTEYIHLIRFMHKAKNIRNIVFFSGINDIYTNMLVNTKSNFDSRFQDGIEKYTCKRKFISYILSKLYFIEQDDIIGLSLKQMLLYPFVKYENKKDKLLTHEEQVDKIFDTFKRNFLLYAALVKQFNVKITYILQPFADWTEKNLSNDEKDVFQYLETLQDGTDWKATKNKLNKELYDKVKSFLSNELNDVNIDFIDSHSYYKIDKTLFVDTVHLNDTGYEVASHIILQNIKG